MEPTYIYVKTDHSEDSLFGNSDPPTSYDDDKLLDSLTQEIQDLYPDVTLSVMATHGQTSVDTDGDPDVEDQVNQLIHETWVAWLEQFDREEAEVDKTALCTKEDSKGNWQPLFSKGFM